MSTTVDDLKIKLEAEAKSAESELDKVIGKVGNLEKTISNIGKGGVATKAFSSLTTGVKKNISDMNSYVDKAAQEMSKSLIKAFDIKGDIGKKAVENLTRDLTMATAKLGKAKAQGQDTSALGAEAKGIRENLVNTIKDLSQVSLAAEKPLQDFVSTIQSISQISVGSEFFKTHPGNIGVDGSLIGRFTKNSGIKLDSLWQDLIGRFPDLIKHDTNAGDQANVINDIFKQYRDSANSSENKDLIASGAKNEINEFITSVKNDMLDMFKTADTRIEEIRARVGDTGKDFANTGGVNLRTPQAIQKAIDNATAQMYKQRETAELSGVGTKGWNSAIERSIVLENHVASLQEKLSQLNMDDATASADRMARATANIDAAIKRILGDTTKMSEEEETVDTGAKTLKLDLMAMANSVSAAKTEMSQLPQTVEETGDAVERTERKASLLSQTFHNISKSIKDELGKGFNIVIPREEFKGLQNEIDTSKEKLNKLQAMMERGLTTNKDFAKTTTFKKLQYDIEETSNSLKHLEGEMADMGKYTHTLNWGMIGGGIKKSFGESIAIIKKATSAVKKFVGALGAPINNAIKNMTKSIGKFSIANMGLVKSLTRTVKMLRLMVVRMALRGVINEAKDSFKELIAFSDKAANSFNLIRNAIHYLADTLAALISPILNASGTFGGLGQIVDAVTDKIVDLINKINQLLAALMGHNTWIKAKKQSKDYASELKKTGKEAKKALQSFDELNNLTSNDSGGGAGDAGANGGHFEELPLSDKWKNIADWLKKMWKNADFTELGTLLGEKLRDALNRIPWDKIQATARKLGKSLATLLNGFFEVPGLAESIGNTIAQAINTGLAFAADFIKNFHFDSFGRFIGVGIVTAIRNINWQEFKDTALLLGKKLAEFVNSLLDTGVLTEIGNAFGNLLVGAINIGFGFVSDMDFDLLGKSLKRGLNAFLDRMNEKDVTGLNGWQKLGKFIGESIKGILTAINTVLGDDATMKKVGDAITDFFNGIDWEGVFSQAKQLIVNLAKAIATVIRGALASEEFRAALGDIGGLIATVFAAKIALNGIGFAVKGIGEKIGTAILTELGSTLTAAAPAISSAMSSIAAAIGASVPVMLGAIGLVVAAIAVWIHNWDEIKEAAALFCERTKEHLDEIKAWFQINLPSFSELVSRISDAIKKKINDDLEALKKIFVFIGDGIALYVTTKLEAIKNNISEKIELAKTLLTNGFEFAKTTVKNVFEEIKIILEGISKAILSAINGDLTGVYNAFVETFNNIRRFISDIIREAAEWGKKIVDGIKSGISSSPVGQAFSTIVRYVRGNADGGVLVNGKWRPIQGYASGGYPASAEMFMARENGMPEMVGRIGSHTAVANNDQIVASVSDGVYRAMMAALNNSSNESNVNIEITGDMARMFKAFRREGNEYQRRTGNPVFA